MNRADRRRTSKFVHQMLRPVMDGKIAAEAQTVREYIDGNLQLARMCMETGHISELALVSLISGLRIAATVAEKDGNVPLMRIIDGADTPAEQILDRFKTGVRQAQRMELAAISAAISATLAALDDMPDAPLVLAYELDRATRLMARERAEAA